MMKRCVAVPAPEENLIEAVSLPMTQPTKVTLVPPLPNLGEGGRGVRAKTTVPSTLSVPD